MDTQVLRFAVFHYLVKQLGNPSWNKMKCLSYLLQEGLGANMQQKFSLDADGPSSGEVDNTNYLLMTNDYIDMRIEPERLAYVITLKREAPEEWTDARDSERKRMNTLLKTLGSRSDPYLELISRTHYVQRQEPNNSREKVKEAVRLMMPKAQPQAIEVAHAEIERLEML